MKWNRHYIYCVLCVIYVIALCGCVQNKIVRQTVIVDIQNNDTAAIEEYIKSGQDVNATSYSGETLLQMACIQIGGRYEIVRMLIIAGADINRRDSVGMSTVLTAAGMADTNTLALLLDVGANINDSNVYGETPLHWAAYGRYDNCKLLIEKNCNVNVMTKSGATPLFYAARSIDTNNVSLLIRYGADTSVRTINGHNALYYAVSCMSYAHAKELLKYGANVEDTEYVSGLTSLHLATNQQDTRIMELLIQAGANINCLDNNARTPLHYIAKRGSPEILEWFLGYHPANTEDRYGMFSIDYAKGRERQREIIVNILRKHGYDTPISRN